MYIALVCLSVWLSTDSPSRFIARRRYHFYVFYEFTPSTSFHVMNPRIRLRTLHAQEFNYHFAVENNVARILECFGLYGYFTFSQPLDMFQQQWTIVSDTMSLMPGHSDAMLLWCSPTQHERDIPVQLIAAHNVAVRNWRGQLQRLELLHLDSDPRIMYVYYLGVWIWSLQQQELPRTMQQELSRTLMLSIFVLSY